MKILEYKRASDLEEAFALLNSHKKSAIIAGGLFLRMQKRAIPLVVDLIDLNLTDIKNYEDHFEIGSMVTLRALEVHEGMVKSIVESVRQISGVGTRNLATLGGSICGRYPFSDIATALMALDATLFFYQRGEMSIRAFFKDKLEEKDILLHIKIPKIKNTGTKYFKPVYTDFSLVNISLAGCDLAVGARPSRAVYKTAVDFNLSPKAILADVHFSDDFRASGAYRRALAESMLTDMIKELEGSNGSKFED